jgi:beta-glucosidase
LFLEPALGLGYPTETLPFLQRIEKWMLPGDEDKLPAPLDFVGLQLYTREVVRRHLFTPLVWAQLVPAQKRNVPTTQMGWEVYPPAIYNLLMQFKKYPNLPPLVITENGAAFTDPPPNRLGIIEDTARIKFLQDYVAELERAVADGAKVDGYFIWTLLDNFEWAEGYRPKFGLVQVDYETQERKIKQSGYWYGELVKKHQAGLVRQS